MVKSFKIPDKSYIILKSLFNLENDEKDAIIETFQKITNPSNTSPKCRVIILELLHLGIFYCDLKEKKILNDLDEFIEAFRISLNNEIQRREKEEIEDIEEKLEKLGVFVHNVLESNKDIYFFNRAMNLLREREKLCLNTRILTDLRPIFEENITNIKNGLILHSLRIEFRNEENRKEIIIFALDHDDLTVLKDNIDRAFKKEDEIRKICLDSEIIIYDE